MTYRNLLEILSDKLSEEQLDMDVTIYDTSEQEYFPTNSFQFYPEDGILDKGHPVIIV